MPWGDDISGEALANWLIAAGGPRPAAGWPTRKLSLLATSMRDYNDVPPELARLAEGRDLAREDASQRLVDLRIAGLVEDRPSRQLTELGYEVNNAWTRFQVGGAAERELARELIIFLEAIKLGVARYREAENFWNQLCARYSADDLLGNWQKLFVLVELSATFNGFSPLRLILVGQQGLAALDTDRLMALAERSAPGNEDAIRGAEAVARRVASADPRFRHVATACLAMVLARSRSETEARATVANFGTPTRGSGWQALPPAEIDLIIGILQAYDCFQGSTTMMELLTKRKNVVLYGPPGTGKTRAALSALERWRAEHGAESVFEVTFHPSYGYEDFVWGIRPQADGTFAGTEGILLRACASARVRPTLMLIDEINRADTARVFGELITYIEPDKRDRPFYIAQDPNQPRSIPANLFFLGTMNTADRSVSLLDTALRRRFAFVEYQPNPAAFVGGWLDAVGGIRLSDLLTVLNNRLGTIGIEADRAIGHALLGISREEANPVAALVDRLEHDIHPLVVDFCFADRGKVRQVLGACVDGHGRFVATTEATLLPALRELIGPDAAAPPN